MACGAHRSRPQHTRTDLETSPDTPSHTWNETGVPSCFLTFGLFAISRREIVFFVSRRAKVNAITIIDNLESSCFMSLSMMMAGASRYPELERSIGLMS